MSCLEFANFAVEVKGCQTTRPCIHGGFTRLG
jgi:hypothetical protein